jgi:DNA-binding NarL/FixJ family response regulator
MKSNKKKIKLKEINFWKDCAFEELANAIHAVVENKIYLSPGIVGVVIKDYVQHLSPNDLLAQAILTDREREVLQLIAEGRSTKKIASILYVSAKTVETHRLNIMQKLNLKSIAEPTKYAICEGPVAQSSLKLK